MATKKRENSRRALQAILGTSSIEKQENYKDEDVIQASSNVDLQTKIVNLEKDLETANSTSEMIFAENEEKEKELDLVRSEKEKISIKMDEIQKKYVFSLIDFKTSRDPDLLNPDNLISDIKDMDKNRLEYVIVECQRLFLLGHHKFYLRYGFQTAEEMAFSLFGLKRTQYHKRRKVWENLEDWLLDNIQNVQSTEHFEKLGFEKFFLLSKLEDKQKIDECYNILVKNEWSAKEAELQLKELGYIPPQQRSRVISRANNVQKGIKKFKEKYIDQLEIVGGEEKKALSALSQVIMRIAETEDRTKLQDQDYKIHREVDLTNADIIALYEMVKRYNKFFPDAYTIEKDVEKKIKKVIDEEIRIKDISVEIL